MIEDLPLISINVRILKFWSFILDHNWRRYISLGPCILLTISQFLDMFISNEPIDSIIRNTYFLVLWFNTLVRALILIKQNKIYERFMINLEKTYYEIMLYEDNEIKILLNQTTRNARVLAVFNLFLGAVSSCGFGLYPLFTSRRVLPFGTTIPGIDKYQSPYYELLYITQMVLTPMGCCMYIPFTSLLVTFIMFGIVQAKLVQYKLRNLRNKSFKNIDIEIEECLKWHKRLISYVNTLNGLMANITLVEFITFGATLCALLFLVVIINAIGQIIFVCAYIIMIFTQILSIYWFANELTVQNLAIATAAYDTPWYDFKRSNQMALRFIMQRAQKILAITVGNIYPISLEIFQSLLNVTYSYFTILRRIYK